MEHTRRLKGKMREKGFTQAMIAQEIGVSENVMSSYLTGKVDPRYKVFIKIFDVLKLSQEERIYILLPETLRSVGRLVRIN